MRAVSATFFALVILAYTFGLAMRMLMKDQTAMNVQLQSNSNMNFETLPRAFWTLGQMAFMLDNTGVILCTLIEADSIVLFISCVVLMVYIILTNLTLLNLMVGQIIDQVLEMK